MNESLILIISNDLPPDIGLAVTAPGLRHYFIYKGLKELGLNVKLAVPNKALEKKWRAKYRNQFYTYKNDDSIIYYSEAHDSLNSIIRGTNAKYVIIYNAMQGDKLKKEKGVKFIFDLFAPKLLEFYCQSQNGHLTMDVNTYVDRKKKLLQISDAFIVNGAKKKSYAYGFGMAAGIDMASLPCEVVHMAVEKVANEKKVKCTKNIAIAGAIQEWTKYGKWLDKLYQYLTQNTEFTLHLLVPNINKSSSSSGDDNTLSKLIKLDNVVLHAEKKYSDYVEFIKKMDFMIDVFERNIEREHAIVSRTVNSLCCGVPVIHADFTELADLIRQYNSGWLINEDGDGLENILDNYQNDYLDKLHGVDEIVNSEFNYKKNALKIQKLLSKL